ncbi:MAG: FAD-binding oxidoreductase [Chloroflexi bacterium]|nr:FAD-binding oxidoreductase [Chloroflexota bacterium]
MAGVQIATTSGGSQTLDDAAVGALSSGLQGKLIQQDDATYDETRAIWNAMIDKRPGLIVQCASASDIVTAVKFAREHDLLVTVRGAGHNIAGKAVCDGGLMIDLSQMKGVRVDAGAKRAFVEPGATLGDLDAATAAHGLATPTGINSTTGIAGLVLGGGFGWLSRKYGMTIDNLVSADVVTADGSELHASEDENSDLFWALRGGGANFGVVTQFEFRLHQVGPDLLSGLIVLPQSQAKEALKKYAAFTKTMPEELNVWAVLRKAPPLPFLPEDVHGTDVIIFAICWVGDPEEGEKAIAPIREWGDPVGEHVGVQPFAAWQQAFDPLLTPGFRNYWKSHNFTEISDGLIDVVVENAGKVPTGHCEVFIACLGGATSRVAPDAMAYSHRDANYVMNVHGRWETAAEDAAGIAWARGAFDGAAPFATGGVYVNFMPDDEDDRVGAAYGVSQGRLADLKKKYDPTNFFSQNQNIKPA